MLRKFIQQEIESTLEGQGHTLTEDKMKRAIDGVEYWIMNGLSESITTAIDDVDLEGGE
jgi:hypothetical protein